MCSVHLLIIDGHKSHLYNLPFYEAMRANNIEVLTIPPFRLTGIYPYDVNAIPESSMAPSDITDKENGEIVLD